MSRKKKSIDEHDYRMMQVEYANQMFREGMSVRQVQEKLNVPSGINLTALARMAIEGVM